MWQPLGHELTKGELLRWRDMEVLESFGGKSVMTWRGRGKKMIISTKGKWKKTSSL